MFTESDKNYEQGFVIDETNLRRIVETINEQLSKVAEPENEIDMQFEVKFRNGSITVFESVDEIFGMENSGSSGVVSIRIQSFIREANNDISGNINRNIYGNLSLIPWPPTGYIMLHFCDREFTDSAPIKCTVRGTSADWVFVTASQLEERLLTSKRNLLPRILRPDWTIFLLVAFASAMVVSSFYVQSEIENFVDSAPQYSDFSMEIDDFIEDEVIVSQELRNAVANNEVSDPIEAIIFTEEMQEKRTKQFVAASDKHTDAFKAWLEDYQYYSTFELDTLLPRIPLALLPVLLLYFYRFLVDKYYPVYNFCWGDYIEYFEQTERGRSFILGAVVLGLILSILGGIIANQFS